jgi:hypothetical protein
MPSSRSSPHVRWTKPDACRMVVAWPAPQRPQEAPATNPANSVRRAAAGGPDTGDAGSRPLGVREPANSVLAPGPSAAPGTTPPSICGCNVGTGPREASSWFGRLAFDARLTVHVGPQSNIPRGDACDGASSPRSRGRPEPPPPGVPLVRVPIRVGARHPPIRSGTRRSRPAWCRPASGFGDRRPSGGRRPAGFSATASSAFRRVDRTG